MTQVLDEQLSAFLDGELPAEEIALLLARLERDAECRRRIARYGLIGEALRGSVHPGSLGIAERVTASIDSAGGERAGTGRATRVRRGAAAAGIAAVAVLAAVVWPGIGALRREPVAATAAVAPTLVRNAPLRTRPLGDSRLTSYLVYHSNYTTAPFRSSLNAHLVNARDTSDGRLRSVEDSWNGR